MDGGPLRIEEALSIRFFPYRTHIALSPTGRHVAYCLADPDAEAPDADPLYAEFDRSGRPIVVAGTSAWVSDVETGETLRLGGPGATSWAPEWSPDGAQIAYYSNETGASRLWVWDLVRRNCREVSEIVVRPFFGHNRPMWCLGGRKLLTKALPAGLTLEEANALSVVRGLAEAPRGRCTAVVYGEEEAVPAGEAAKPNGNNVYLSDLVLVDLETGDTSTVGAGIRPTCYVVSPDGQSVMYTAYEGEGETWETYQSIGEVVVLSLPDGARRLRLAGIPFFCPTAVSWSPDGRRIAFEDNGMNFHGQCHVVDLNSGERHCGRQTGSPSCPCGTARFGRSPSRIAKWSAFRSNPAKMFCTLWLLARTASIGRRMPAFQPGPCFWTRRRVRGSLHSSTSKRANAAIFWPAPADRWADPGFSARTSLRITSDSPTLPKASGTQRTCGSTMSRAQRIGRPREQTPISQA